MYLFLFSYMRLSVFSIPDLVPKEVLIYLWSPFLPGYEMNLSRVLGRYLQAKHKTLSLQLHLMSGNFGNDEFCYLSKLSLLLEWKDRPC